jgi:hypothetical protein
VVLAHPLKTRLIADARLIQPNTGSSIVSNAYLYGAGGLVKNLSTNSYYYQEASGSTSHLSNSSGTPILYNASNTQISGSNYGVRHLFTGQQWYSELGLYDLRSRFTHRILGASCKRIQLASTATLQICTVTAETILLL